MDRIIIRELELDCVVGVNPWERHARQRIRLHIELECDLSMACQSDSLDDTLDYVKLRDILTALSQSCRPFLIERFAELVAQCCLEQPRVHQVHVTLDKPGALTGARSVAVAITRQRRSAEPESQA